MKTIDQLATARTKVWASTLLGVFGFAITALLGHWYAAPLIAWDIAALVFVFWTWGTVWNMSEADTEKFALREDPSRAVADVVVVIASVASLLAVGILLARASQSEGVIKLAQIVLGIISVVLSWTVVHTIFMLRYSEMYYTKPLGGIEFNSNDRPAYKDFAYLAFTIGMTFQVSDTALQGKKFRATALRHAAISYLFGTVIVATTINLIAGLSK